MCWHGKGNMEHPWKSVPSSQKSLTGEKFLLTGLSLQVTPVGLAVRANANQVYQTPFTDPTILAGAKY